MSFAVYHGTLFPENAFHEAFTVQAAGYPTGPQPTAPPLGERRCWPQRPARSGGGGVYGVPHHGQGLSLTEASAVRSIKRRRVHPEDG